MAALGGRATFEIAVVREPGVPWILEAGRVRNQVDLHVTNKSPDRARIKLAVVSPVPADVRLGSTTVELASLGDTRVPLVISVERCDVRPDLPFTLVATSDAGLERRQLIRFVAAPLGAADRARCAAASPPGR